MFRALAANPEKYHAFADLSEAIGGDQLDDIAHVKSRLVKLLKQSGLGDLAASIKTQKGHYGLFLS